MKQNRYTSTLGQKSMPKTTKNTLYESLTTISLPKGSFGSSSMLAQARELTKEKQTTSLQKQLE